MSFYFHQINIRDIDNEIDLIKKRRSEKNTVVIGLEITHSKIGELLDINIDPQHNGSISDYNKKITCVEKIKELFPKLIKYKYKRIYIYFLKTDLDSISAAVMLDLLFNYQKPFTKNVLMRFNYISESDKHGRAKYNKTKNHNQKIPRGLFMFISGWKNDLNEKIQLTKNWIISGSFKNIDKYNEIANNNFKEFVYSSKVETIIPNKLILVKSTKRGACGLGYQHAPIVIALNPSYRFGLGETRVYGKKWVIAQYNEKFIDLTYVLKELQKLEENWGGSSVIIGSPQDQPSKITKNQIIDIIKKIVV